MGDECLSSSLDVDGDLPTKRLVNKKFVQVLWGISRLWFMMLTVILKKITSWKDEVTKMERNFSNPIAKAAFAINCGERNELIAIRKKMIELQKFLERNGLLMAQFEKEMFESDRIFNSGLADPSQFITDRNEFGLPIFKD